MWFCFRLSTAYGMGLAKPFITGESMATHPMVITAVHVDNTGRLVRYKVENPLSKTTGTDGWFMISADWFGKYVYQVVVLRSFVDARSGRDILRAYRRPQYYYF
ncbi:hypothetical protein CspHIS471_0207930 [Cutaneotrichosporon sp. HIS471]|nr:hypothetical protein CspHIS471_0207930 [Cutaneotrichosporon sp. HIS471]